MTAAGRSRRNPKAQENASPEYPSGESRMGPVSKIQPTIYFRLCKKQLMGSGAHHPSVNYGADGYTRAGHGGAAGCSSSGGPGGVALCGRVAVVPAERLGSEATPSARAPLLVSMRVSVQI